MAAQRNISTPGALQGLQRQNSEGDRNPALLCQRADDLSAAGRKEQAKAIYLEALNLDPTHFATLINFGTLLYETDFRTAARTVFAQAVRFHPHEPIAHVNLANTLMYADELAPAREHYEIALKLDPDNIHAHQRLSSLFQDLGDMDAMRRHHRLGFSKAPPRQLPCLGDGKAISLLLLSSAPGGDVSWRRLIDRQVFSVTELTAEFHDPATPLPPHDLIFNAIGDADLSGEAAVAAQALVARSSAPVINDPTRVLTTGRMANALRLGSLPGVTTPRTRLFPRSLFEDADAGDRLAQEGFADYPLLLRSPGFHTGRHFVRVETREVLNASAAVLPGEQLMAIQYLDACGVDGHARKYRVMMIGDRLYPLHLAISRDWKVHYFNGAMDGAADFQAEEARFLDHMPDALGPRAMAALQAIQAALGLDYAGADFALDADGGVLLFEANAIMNMIPPGPSPQWDYRRPAIARAMAAAQAMFVAKCAPR